MLCIMLYLECEIMLYVEYEMMWYMMLLWRNINII